MEKGSKLTAKQAKFVQEYLIDLNAGGAATRAGYRWGSRVGYRLLRYPAVQHALSVARQELSAQSGVTPDMVIKGLRDLAFSDLAKCFESDGAMKNIHDIDPETRQALSGIEILEEYAGKGGDRTLVGYTKKIRTYDKNRALDALAKHFGLYDADNRQKSDPLSELLRRIDGKGLPKPGGE